MFNWKETPYLKLLIPFILGIYLANEQYFNLYINVGLIIFLLCFFISLLSYKKFMKSHQLRWLFGIVIYLILFTAGMTAFQLSREDTQSSHFKNHINANSILVGKILEPISIKQNSYKTIIHISQCINDNDTVTTTGKLLCYFPKKDSSVLNLKYGDIIITPNQVFTIQSAKNPNQFNYANYLFLKKIYHQQYVKKWVQIGYKPTFIYRWIYSIRKYVIATLQSHISSKSELGIIAALLVGYKDLLDAETASHYSKTGTIHVLAVSGLHVGIIYWIMGLFLGLLFKEKKSKLWKGLLIITSIWLYGMLTGLQPSVQRACVMFSFIAIGNMLNRKSSIYNSISCSAFFLLAFNPFLLFDVGFQLSYTAVFGIVALQPIIYSLVYIRNKWLEKIWLITSTSLAAQLATLPITVYYFNQIPSYSIFANILVVPAITFVLYLGLGFIILSPLPAISDWIGTVLKYFLQALNFCVEYISNIPYALIDQLFLEKWEVFALFFLLISLTYSFVRRNKPALLLSFLVALVLSINNLTYQWQTMNQKSITLYTTSKGSLLEFVHGKAAIIFYEESEIPEKDIAYAVKGNHMVKNIHYTKYLPIQMLEIDYRSQLIEWNNYLIHYDSMSIQTINLQTIKKLDFDSLSVDYILATKSTPFDFQNLNKVHSSNIIIDVNNRKSYSKALAQFCKNNKIDFIDLKKETLEINL